MKNYLKDKGYFTADKVVDDLIEGGFIKADKISEPERIALAACKWLGENKSPGYVFDYASGWNTSSWETVLKTRIDTNEKVRFIFYALIILAKNAGIEL